MSSLQDRWLRMSTKARLVAGAGGLAAVLGLIWLATDRGGVSVPEGVTVIHQRDLVQPGGKAQTPMSGATPSGTPEEQMMALSQGIELLGAVDEYPKAGEAVYAISIQEGTHLDYAFLHRLMAFGTNVMMKNGNGRSMFLVYTDGRRYGQGATLLVTTNIGRPATILTSGMYPYLERLAGHIVSTEELNRATKPHDGQIENILDKHLLVSIPVTDFYLAQDETWIILSTVSTADKQPLVLPVHISPNDPLLGDIQKDMPAVLQIVLTVDKKDNALLVNGRIVSTKKHPLPDPVPETAIGK